MNTLELPGLSVAMNDEGFLLDPSTWTPGVAEALAIEEGIAPLTDRHWEVIHFCRAAYELDGEPPTLRRITTKSGVPTKELYSLFPKGPAKKVSRLAGLGKPKGCI